MFKIWQDFSLTDCIVPGAHSAINISDCSYAMLYTWSKVVVLIITATVSNRLLWAVYGMFSCTQ